MREEERVEERETDGVSGLKRERAMEPRWRIEREAGESWRPEEEAKETPSAVLRRKWNIEERDRRCKEKKMEKILKKN